MICQRCKKDFNSEHKTIVEWMFAQQQLNLQQVQYVKDSYNAPICNECIHVLIECFYVIDINPMFRSKLKDKIW